MLETMMGMPSKYETSGQFEEAVIAAERKLGGYKSFPGMSEMHAAFRKYFFRPELTETPVSTYRTLFTPKLLKETLELVTNPATGENLIDSSEEIRAESEAVDSKTQP